MSKGPATVGERSEHEWGAAMLISCCSARTHTLRADEAVRKGLPDLASPRAGFGALACLVRRVKLKKGHGPFMAVRLGPPVLAPGRMAHKPATLRAPGGGPWMDRTARKARRRAGVRSRVTGAAVPCGRSGQAGGITSERRKSAPSPSAMTTRGNAASSSRRSHPVACFL